MRIKYTALGCYFVGIIALLNSLPLVWYTDGFGDLRGIDGRYYYDLELAGSAVLRMPVIAFGVAAIFGFLALLGRSKFVVSIAFLGIVSGGWIFIFGTLGIVHPAFTKFASGELGAGAYVFAAGALVATVTTIVVLVDLIRNPVVIEPDQPPDDGSYPDGSSNFWG